MQEQLKAQFYLWQLFHMDQDLAAERRLAAARKAEMLDAGRALKAMEEELDATKKRAATHNKERLLLERKIAKRRADADKKARPFACHLVVQQSVQAITKLNEVLHQDVVDLCTQIYRAIFTQRWSRQSNK